MRDAGSTARAAHDEAMTTEIKPLSGEEIAKMLALANEADSVELKLTVPEVAQRSAITALDLDPLEGQVRQVFFFDTPDLDLNKAGLVARARRTQGRADDTVMKLRPVVPVDIPADLRKLANFAVEVDSAARRLCVLRVVQRRARTAAGPRRHARQASDSQVVLE